jgi:hypothetical protein
MSAITEMDDLVRKLVIISHTASVIFTTLRPAYIPDLKCFIAKLPSHTHNSFIYPMAQSMDRAIRSMPVSEPWDISFSTQTTTHINNTRSAHVLGIPDLLLEMDGPSNCVALWIVEVGYSQTEDDLLNKIRQFATGCEGAQAITMIDVRESQPYKRPKDSSELAIAMEGRDLLTLEEWRVASDNPAFGSVTSSARHPWASPLTIVVKTWLRHPNGEFSIDERNDSAYYACAVSHYRSFSKLRC